MRVRVLIKMSDLQTTSLSTRTSTIFVRGCYLVKQYPIIEFKTFFLYSYLYLWIFYASKCSPCSPIKTLCFSFSIYFCSSVALLVKMYIPDISMSCTLCFSIIFVNRRSIFNDFKIYFLVSCRNSSFRSFFLFDSTIEMYIIHFYFVSFFFLVYFA